MEGKSGGDSRFRLKNVINAGLVVRNYRSQSKALEMIELRENITRHMVVELKEI